MLRKYVQPPSCTVTFLTLTANIMCHIVTDDRLCCRWVMLPWLTTPWSSSHPLGCKKHLSFAAGWPVKSKITYCKFLWYFVRSYFCAYLIQWKILTWNCVWQEVKVVSTHLSKHSAHHHFRPVPLPGRCTQGCWCKESCALWLCACLWWCGVKYRYQPGTARAQVGDILL